MTGRPRVSVLTLTKNSARTIRRCLRSVLDQDYPEIEFIVQDGLSRDGTLEEIARHGRRIELFSEPDQGPEDAHLKGLGRCTGDLITMCWSDEELAPGAISRGVRILLEEPELGGIYGDVYSTDLLGNLLDPSQRPGFTPPWDLERYLRWDMIPNYVGSLVWREKLAASGFFEAPHSVMYDYFGRLGLRYPVRYIPGFVGKFCVHGGQLSSRPEVLFGMLDNLLASIDAILGDPRTPEQYRALRRRAKAGVHLAMIHSLLVNAGSVEDALEMLGRALEHDPEPGQLARVAWEAFDFLARRKRLAEALAFLDRVRAAGRSFAGLNYGRAFALTLLGRFERVAEAVHS